MEHCLSIIAAASYFILNDHLQPSPHDMTSFLKLLLLLFLETHISVRAETACQLLLWSDREVLHLLPKNSVSAKTLDICFFPLSAISTSSLSWSEHFFAYAKTFVGVSKLNVIFSRMVKPKYFPLVCKNLF